MTKTPLAIIASRIYLPEAAAASFRLGSLAASLKKQGLKVHVLTAKLGAKDASKSYKKNGGSPEIGPGGENIYRAAVLRDKTGYLRGYLPYLSFDLPLFFRLLFHARPTIVICEPPPTTGFFVRLACMLRRVPYVFYAADIWHEAAASTGAPAVVVKILRKVESWVWRGAKGVITVNEEMKELISLQLSGLEANKKGAGTKVQVVENGIDTTIFHPKAQIEAKKMTEILGGGWEDKKLLVYAGTASEWQGAQVFVQALKLMRSENKGLDAALVFIGSGTSITALQEAGRGIDPEFLRFCGQVTPAEAAAIQARAHAALVSIRPAIGYDFAYPTKVLSALACGTAVVYAGVGPARMNIENEDMGWVCDHDPANVAQGFIQALAKNPDASQSERLHSWVLSHRSLQATGSKAAQFAVSLCTNLND